MKKRILLLDDEDLILDLLEELFAIFGFDSEICKTGEEVLEKFKLDYNSNKNFEFVVLDYSIPRGKGAFDIIEELRVINPNIKIALSTGMEKEDFIDKPLFSYFDCILKKPYEILEIKRFLTSNKL